MLKARREGSGQVTRGGAAAQKLSPITCHSPHHHRIGASVHPPAPVLPARTHDMRGLKASAEGFLLFASLLFILLHQKKPSFAPGLLPPHPHAPSLKPAASATREILMVQSQHRGSRPRRDLSGAGAACAESMPFVRSCCCCCCSSSLP